LIARIKKSQHSTAAQDFKAQLVGGGKKRAKRGRKEGVRSHSWGFACVVLIRVID
jgi:hypothetical protein